MIIFLSLGQIFRDSLYVWIASLKEKLCFFFVNNRKFYTVCDYGVRCINLHDDFSIIISFRVAAR